MTPPPAQKSSAVPRLLAGKTIAVVGLGQIGGSIVKCLSRHRPQMAILGTDTDRTLAKRAARYCHWCDDLDDVVISADLVILAVHVPHILSLLGDVASRTSLRTQRSRLLVADTGTIKDPVVRIARRYRKAFDFVAMHPLAGNQRTGWPGSETRLFAGCTTVYCPEGSTRSARLIRELIQLLGSKPFRMRPDDHDRCIGLTIGLPHLLAYGAQGLAADLGVPSVVKGNSWASLTRIAASDPAMVTGFLCTNAKATAAAARQFTRRLDRLIAALNDPTGRTMETLLRQWRREAAA